ncbi:MAG: hypothetical protein KDE31_35485, partial [Caldilineaceae bacterium]|nr:hypothetical protein [Caldilineaceae bacterium]
VLQSWPELRQLLDTSGAIQTSPDQLQVLVQKEFTAINDVTQTMLTALAPASANAAAVSSATAPSAVAAISITEPEIIALQQALNRAKPKVDALAKFVRRYDPELGDRISVVGNSAVKIAESVLQIGLGVAQLASGSVSVIGVIGGVSSIVTGVSGLASVFKNKNGGSTPPIEEIILQEIRKLQQQVTQLREEMHERFDRIDRTLNLIMDTLVIRFDQIDQNVADLQRQLLAVDALLHQLSQNMYQVVADGFQQDLWLLANRAHNYKASGTALPYDTYANVFAIDFASWATALSYNAVYNPPSAGGYDNAAAYDQLTSGLSDSGIDPDAPITLDRNLNYLFRLLRNRWPTLAPTAKDLPNPTIWAIAARAYTELSLDWRDHAAQLDQTRRNANAIPYGEQIANTGRELQSALQQIARRTTSSGIQANYPLFDALFANYQAEATNLDQELQKIETAFLQELRTRPEPDRAEVINLWGGA